MPQKSEEKRRYIPPIQIRDAKLIYLNFSGKAKKYNAKGLRNFNVLVDLETAEILQRDGWNIKFDEPREEGDPRRARLKVNVRFEKYPPRIVLVTEGGKNVLDEEDVSILDVADIKTVDMKLTASTGLTREGTPYVTAYLAKMFVTLDENDLELKYATPSRHADDDED